MYFNFIKSKYFSLLFMKRTSKVISIVIVHSTDVTNPHFILLFFLSKIKMYFVILKYSSKFQYLHLKLIYPK